ncbi:MAG TPA: magnesium and cobalt transport protein CorA [Phycisphaerales bacterium]|nr:magnesium and cobalt transport protein CorA [Phycisphaerales bacterium]
MAIKKRLKRLRRSLMATRAVPGAPPGTLIRPPDHAPPLIRVIAYCDGSVEERQCTTVEEVRAFRRAGWVLWVNIDGLGDPDLLSRMGEAFGLHPLALEDVIDTHQRPKVERYDNALFVIMREIRLNHRVESEQLALFLLDGVVISFQETVGDVFDPVRNRIRSKSGKIRARGADYLAYALVDATIDSYFPILEQLGERVDDIEDSLVGCPKRSDVRLLHEAKRDFFHVRRAMWPMREAVTSMVREENPLISDETRMYLRDCSDHAVRIVDLVETGREICSDLMDVYLSSMSHRMNNVMKVLTIISTIFIPLTFLAGVYGMNFDRAAGPASMPELGWPMGYVAFWIVCAVIACGLIGAFWWLGWLGGDAEGDR